MSGLSEERTKIGVIGGGAWGTALALHCARMGHTVLMWAREPEVRCKLFAFLCFTTLLTHTRRRLQVVQSINGPAKENTVFLPGECLYTSGTKAV